MLSPHLTAEIHSAKAGRHLANKLSLLAQKHYELAITTVTGIPMKVSYRSKGQSEVISHTSNVS